MHQLALIALLALGGAKSPRTIDVDCRTDFRDRCSAGMYKKEIAPFDGVLMSGALAAHLYLMEKNTPERLRLAVQKEVDLREIEVKHQKDLNQINKENFDEKLEIMATAHAQALELIRPSWYEHPAFIIPMSVGGTLLLVWMATEVLEKRQ